MPKSVERCVKKVKTKITPKKKGQSKTSAAYAVCTAAHKKSKKK